MLKYLTPLLTGVTLVSVSGYAFLSTINAGGNANSAVTPTHLTPTNTLSSTAVVDKPNATPSAVTPPSNVAPTPTATPVQPVAQQPPARPPTVFPPLAGSVSNATPVAVASTLSVDIYLPDSRCETLLPTKVSIPADTPAQAAIGKVLEQRDTADFSLAGYRVSVNPSSRVATVDLRIAPGSQRKFVSLSTCEQFALFGSLRKTLTSNPTLNIRDVRFTEQGQELYL